uniref:54S ribosomal protein L12, mitochondrial n=1 Tax=Lygus hesperus TaxID=30085 RepID=A0A0A9XSX8_LYGHE
MLQTIELVDELKRVFKYTDISFAPAAGTATNAAAAPSDAAGEQAPPAAVVEKTSFAVRLESFDTAQKVKVIKEVRAITSLGLKEAKELVESAPKVIKKDLTKEEAQKLVDLLHGCGGKCVLE